MIALLRLLGPYKWRVALAVLLGTAVVASNMGLLGAAAYLVAAASVTHLMAVLLIPMYTVRLLSATRGAARYAERLVSHRVTFDLLAQLRVRLFDQLWRLGPAGLRGAHSGDTLGRLMADVEQLQNAYLLFVAPCAVALVVSLLLVSILLIFSSGLAWATLGYLVVGAVALPLLVAARSRQAGRALVLVRAELNAHLVETIQGSRDLVSNGATPRFLARLTRDGQRLAHAETRLALVSAGREGAIELVTSLALLSALALAIPLVTGHALLGVYVAVPALLVLASFEAIRPLGQVAEAVSGVRAAAGRVLELEARQEPVRDSAAPVPLNPPFSLAFEGVTLEYGGARKPAVQGVSFEIPAGYRVAVVGLSGAGKTSLVRLLTRAWDPSKGHVLIAGRDIREYALHDLRATISVVAQDSYIFNDTVRNNLRLAHPEATDAELEEALREVGLLEMVRGLPRGLDTWVGEHGAHLSGGERQRLAVARVLLQDAPIVVLDEVTANLDPLTERDLLATLDRVTAGRTVLMITHRLLGLERMDEIVVLDGGRVIERGQHATLYAAGGLYRRMLDVQENMLAV